MAALLALIKILVLISASNVVAESPSLKDVLEADTRLEQAMEQAESSETIEPGITPLSSVLAIRSAWQRQDLEALAQFFDTRYLPDEMVNMDPTELANKLAIVWSINQILDFSSVSNAPEGHLNDGLPSYRDQLGTIALKGNMVPIYLQRIPGDDGRTWKISNATVAKIPELWEEYGYNPYLLQLQHILPEFSWLHINNWQWASFVLMVAGAWAASTLLKALMLRLIAYSETYRETMHRFFAVPLRWFIFFKLLQLGVGELGLSLKARVYLNASAFGYIATTFLVLAAIEFSTALFLSKTQDVRYWSGIIRPVRSILKMAAVLIIALIWIAESGYNISTLLAGLGIGSLALALAAQKTLENIIGAITLYIAKPIRPGDFCKFADVSGIVEEIGLRSTRIRRLDRTVVHVPNSALMGVNVENISETDRRQFSRELRVALSTSKQQLAVLLEQLREMIQQHPHTLADALRVRFQHIERDAYNILVNCYVNTSDFDEYLGIVESLNLQILDILHQNSVQLAIPQQSVMLSQPATNPGSNHSVSTIN